MTVVALLVLAVAVVVAIVVHWRRQRVVNQKSIDVEDFLLTDTQRTILILEEKLRDERASPVPDFALVRHYQNELFMLEEKREREAAGTPWDSPKP